MPALWQSIPSELTLASSLITLATLAILYNLGAIVYNLFFHPLSKYPGPKLWAVSRVPYSISWLSGSGHKKIYELHQKYGDIVRIAPNELVFGAPSAWDDMMGHRKRGQDENGKDPDFWPRNDNLTLVGSDRERHGRLRKILSHGFSAQAMADQQPVFHRYVSLLMERLKMATANGEAQDMVSWYNWTTFDMVGDLMFGESFGCLENADYHPWVNLIFKHIKGVLYSTVMIRFPIINYISQFLIPKDIQRDMQTHAEFVEAQVAKRLAFDDARPDFMESMIKAREKSQISHSEILANAHNLIVGGSETTATVLSGTTYLLAVNQPVLAKLEAELRASFSREDEIDLLSVQKLQYMMAVFDEGLRIYPPVPSAIPRKTPSNGSVIGDNYVPPNTIISIWQWPMFHSPKYFRDPESFVPERWLGDPRFDSDQKNALQPFSVGPRNCIGKNLAYAEMRLILARLVWNFHLELDPRSEGWLEKNVLSFLWEKPPLYVRLTPRAIS
ncbi:cytochrome P450 [Dactylonectria macrodidyma]|uniref:Cytochrome P450 n=1 Tax=Dactylonectria macrodidyma TaxID=307937 RepID=A0A9P9EQT3_9HYPO|nr:cytochrome P450 [Dactylonectria macrodidyma]